LEITGSDANSTDAQVSIDTTDSIFDQYETLVMKATVANRILMSQTVPSTFKNTSTQNYTMQIGTKLVSEILIVSVDSADDEISMDGENYYMQEIQVSNLTKPVKMDIKVDAENDKSGVVNNMTNKTVTRVCTYFNTKSATWDTLNQSSCN